MNVFGFFLQEVDALRPFLPEMPSLRVHPVSIPQEVCQWPTSQRVFRMWKDIGQWVNLWADNFSKAEYIMQLDTDTVFNFPITKRTLFDTNGQPFLPFWSGCIVFQSYRALRSTPHPATSNQD